MSLQPPSEVPSDATRPKELKASSSLSCTTGQSGQNCYSKFVMFLKCKLSFVKFTHYILGSDCRRSDAPFLAMDFAVRAGC